MRRRRVVVVPLPSSACTLDPFPIGANMKCGTKIVRALLAAVFVLSGCGLDPFNPIVSPTGRDAGARDGGTPDAGGIDAGRNDAGPPPDACVPSGLELCDGVDNDCDATTPDGFAEPTLGDACDGPDTDVCVEGEIVCMGRLLCDDTSDSSTESCNAMDDDCDGSVDEDAVCEGCERAEFRGEPYLFCTNRRGFAEAQVRCAMLGYSLATLTDSPEDDFVWTTAMSIRSEEWRIGLNDNDLDGTYTWISGSSAVYRNLGPGEPGGSGGCAVYWSGSPHWRGLSCGVNRSYVCDRD